MILPVFYVTGNSFYFDFSSYLCVYAWESVILLRLSCLPQCLCLPASAIGAALGPTDLVAYSAISKRFSFPKWISYILQGEGALNDASGLVAFQVAVTALTTGAFSLLDASWNLVISVLGGFWLA